LRPFVPLFTSPHLATIAGNYWPRKLDTARFPVRERLCRTAPEVQVLVKEQRPEGAPKGEIVLLHALLVAAQDDPLVPFEVFSHPSVTRNPAIRLLAADQGGHLGFLARGSPRFWLDETLLGWIQETGNIR